MAMARIELTSAWQEVFAGAVDNVVLQSTGPCDIAIGTSAPSGGSIDIAIKLRLKPEGSGYEFASAGLTGQKIYARENSGDGNTFLTVASW